MKKGFTLIELLVVVLIIGILATVALPQYQKVVERSKSTQALTLLRAIVQSAISYRMATGGWPESFDEISIDVPWTGSTKWCALSPVIDTRSNEEWSLQLYHVQEKPGLAVYVGRINGKYKGAAFVSSTEANGKITCAERKTNGVIFDLNEGDYCEKIMKGTLTDRDSQTFRSYSMP